MNEEVALVRHSEGENVIEVHESYEPAKLALGLGLRKITDCLDFLRDRSNTVAVDVVSEEIEGGGGINYDSVRRQSGEYCP